MRRVQYVPTYVTEEVKITISKFKCCMSMLYASKQHIKLSNIINIHVTLWQIVYIYMAAISPNFISRLFLVVLVAGEDTCDTRVNDKKTYGPPHESSLLIASLSNEGSAETGHIQRLARAFTDRIHKAWM